MGLWSFPIGNPFCEGFHKFTRLAPPFEVFYKVIVQCTAESSLCAYVLDVSIERIYNSFGSSDVAIANIAIDPFSAT